MELHVEEMLTQVTDFIKTEANAKTVIGDPFTLGEFSCIPVIRIGMGFGSGAGEGDELKKVHNEGSAVGAGMGIEPLGFLVSRGKEINFLPVKTNKGLAAAFEKVPEMIEKYMEMKAKEEKVALNN